MTTYVLVHGGWHGGWCWKRATPIFLRDAGHTVYTPTLIGLGERSHLASPETNHSTHIQDILNILWYEDLNDVILVGHSYGGMVITGVADAAPERIAKIVYLDAFVPENGQSLMTIFRPASSQEASPKPPVIDDWRVPYPYRERPFGITDQSDSQWVLDKITPQPIQAFTEPIRLKNGGSSKIPRTYIHLRPPVGLPPETEFFQFAERARTQPDWKYQELVSGHDAMIIIPEAVAALLLEQDKDM
ncbi:MAG: alpha/beta hydrolase [Anaerolineales bacterium]|nr:alpha/beta hydrolase [Anaerolineales bacterium]